MWWPSVPTSVTASTKAPSSTSPRIAAPSTVFGEIRHWPGGGVTGVRFPDRNLSRQVRRVGPAGSGGHGVSRVVYRPDGPGMGIRRPLSFSTTARPASGARSRRSTVKGYPSAVSLAVPQDRREAQSLYT